MKGWFDLDYKFLFLQSLVLFLKRRVLKIQESRLYLNGHQKKILCLSVSRPPR